MTAAGEAQLDAVMKRALPQHPLAHAGFDQQIDRVLLEHAGAQRRFDVGAAARFEHDRFDAGKMQEMREQQSGGPRADDGDLRSGRRGIRLNHVDGASGVFAIVARAASNDMFMNSPMWEWMSISS